MARTKQVKGATEIQGSVKEPPGTPGVGILSPIPDTVPGPSSPVSDTPDDLATELESFLNERGKKEEEEARALCGVACEAALTFQVRRLITSFFVFN